MRKVEQGVLVLRRWSEIGWTQERGMSQWVTKQSFVFRDALTGIETPIEGENFDRELIRMIEEGWDVVSEGGSGSILSSGQFAKLRRITVEG